MERLDEQRFFRKVDELTDRKIIRLILTYGPIPPEIWDYWQTDLHSFYFEGLGDLLPEQIVCLWQGLFFDLEEILKERKAKNVG